MSLSDHQIELLLKKLAEEDRARRAHVLKADTEKILNEQDRITDQMNAEIARRLKEIEDSLTKDKHHG